MSDILEPGAPLPVNLGRCVDLYHDIRAARLLMQKEVEQIAKREAEVREHLIANIHRAQDSGGVVGLRYMARRVEKTTYRFAAADEERAAGWGRFTSWVRKHDYFHMLQKRLNETAVAEFVANEQRIPPGLDQVKVPDISVTKIG